MSRFYTIIISAASTALAGRLIDSSRIPNDQRSETFTGILGTPVRPHGFRLDTSAIQNFDVRRQPRVNVLVRGVTVRRQITP